MLNRHTFPLTTSLWEEGCIWPPSVLCSSHFCTQLIVSRTWTTRTYYLVSKQFVGPLIGQTGIKSELLLLLMLSRFSCVRLCATHRRQPTRLLCPWDSPGKNTGVSCHFLLQCMKVKSESEVDQSCPTLSDPMDFSLPGSSAHGIFQARVLGWIAITFSKKWVKKRAILSLTPL